MKLQKFPTRKANRNIKRKQRPVIIDVEPVAMSKISSSYGKIVRRRNSWGTDTDSESRIARSGPGFTVKEVFELKGSERHRVRRVAYGRTWKEYLRLTEDQCDLRNYSDGSWVHDPEGILQRLENRDAYPDDLHAAVLFAEVKPFNGDQRTRLLAAFNRFIEANRFVEDEDSLVILCSAIRKYAMNMTKPHFESYANWLIPTETATLHHEAEMEFAKGICWRLEFEPIVWPASFPKLAGTLFEMAYSYLTPRLILQKSYANTAMFSIVALHILEAISDSNIELVAKLHKKIAQSKVKWFSEMIEDNLNEAVHYIAERDAALAKKVTEIRQR